MSVRVWELSDLVYSTVLKYHFRGDVHVVIIQAARFRQYRITTFETKIGTY